MIGIYIRLTRPETDKYEEIQNEHQVGPQEESTIAASLGYRKLAKAHHQKALHNLGQYCWLKPDVFKLN